ncbi:MAG TPA: hypothetical protein VK699_16435 [Terriglobales bacterium]|nr:hypothetical protein [Terriglobales bacterium]
MTKVAALFKHILKYGFLAYGGVIVLLLAGLNYLGLRITWDSEAVSVSSTHPPVNSPKELHLQQQEAR